MRVSHVVGKEIVRVEQERVWNKQTATWAVLIKRITLSDGSKLTFHTVELGDEYGVEMTRYT